MADPEPEAPALVVGGTGMLRPVAVTLSQSRPVAVVARSGERLDALVKKYPAIIPVAVDWTKTRDLERALWKVVDRQGAFSLCVAWIHSDAPKAPAAVAQFVRGRFFHVLGSEVADPDNPDPDRRARFEANKAITYHEVVLGFVLQRGGSRWLTNQEIARGVLTAVAWARPRTVVGVVAPWKSRPEL